MDTSETPDRGTIADGASNTEPAAADGSQPVWRILPTMTPGAAYGSAVAPPVYRSLRIVGTFRGANVNDYPVATAAPGHSQGDLRGAMPMPAANVNDYPVAVPVFPGFVNPGYLATNYAVNGATGAPVLVGPANSVGSAASFSDDDTQLLTQAPILPFVFHRSAKHFIAYGALRDLGTHMAEFAPKQGARLIIKTHNATMKLKKLAPPTAPDDGCSDVVWEIRIFLISGQGAKGPVDPAQYLMDFTHRKGSRVVACELYREVVASLRAAKFIQTPVLDHLLDDDGNALPCQLYKVPSFRLVPVGPAVAAATVKPLLAAAVSPCFDQKRAACQLLARMTASKRTADKAVAAAGGGGSGEGAMQDDEEEDSSDYMSNTINCAMLDPVTHDAVVKMLACLCNQPVAASGAVAASVLPHLHEDVRCCIMSTVANMALHEMVATDGSGTHTRQLIEAAKALEAVRRALPTGGDPVLQGTYSSPQARDALAEAAK